jgi:integrase
MPKLKMTDAAVRSTTAEPGQRIDYFDAHPRDRQRGLVLRVSGSRDVAGAVKVSRTWAALCRVRGSTKLRRFTIGDYPGIGLGDARARAGKIVADAHRDGVDPLRERKVAERQAEIANKDTVAAVVEAYLADLAKRPKKKGGMRAPRYIEETRRNFGNHVLPRWATLNVRDITRRDVGDLLESVMDEGSTVKQPGKRRTMPGGKIAANRTLAAIRAMFNYAMRRGIIDTTPVAMVEPPAVEKPRDRTLAPPEIAAIWKAAAGMSYPFGPYFRLALVLGQRRNEIAGMRWADLDLRPDAATWVLPAEATKAGRAHAVPLPPLALNILMALPRKTYTADGKTRASPYVFTTEGDRPISGFSKAKPALDRAITKARDGKPLDGWTIHDMRRTAATEMARLGASEFIVGKVLNHATQGVTGKVYNHYEYLTEKRAALEKWAQCLENLTAPRGANVVPLRELRA